MSPADDQAARVNERPGKALPPFKPLPQRAPDVSIEKTAHGTDSVRSNPPPARRRPLLHRPPAGRARGGSRRIARFTVMTQPPSIDGGEITDNGYVNPRATLDRRKALVDALYSNPPGPNVVVI